MFVSGDEVDELLDRIKQLEKTLQAQRKAPPGGMTVEDLCALLYDLSIRGGMDEAFDNCRLHMAAEDVERLDRAIAYGASIIGAVRKAKQ